MVTKTPSASDLQKLAQAGADSPAVAKLARKSAASGAVESGATSGPSTFDRVLDGTEKGLNLLGMGTVLGLPLIKGAGGLVEKTGLKKVGKAIQAPVDFLENETAQSVGTRTGIGGTVGRAFQGTFNAVGSTAQWLGDKTGFSNWRTERNQMKAFQHGNRAMKIADSINVAGAHPELHPHLNEMKEAAATLDAARFGKAREALDKLVKDPAIAKASEAQLKNLNKLGAAVETGAFHKTGASRSIKETFTSMPGSMSKAKLGQAVYHGSFIAMSALGTFGVARGFFSNLKSLRQMEADVEGVAAKDVSMTKLILGNVAKPVADARSQLLKSAGVEGGMQAFWLLFQIREAMGGKISVAKSMGLGMASMGVSALMGKSVVPYYESLSNAHKRGEKLPPEAYAEFLGVVSPELKARGGAENPLTKALAEKYAAANASPAQLIKDIDSGKVMADAHALMNKAEVAKAAAPAQAVESSVSHTARLAGEKKAASPIVGKHTATVAAQAENSKAVGPTV